MKKHVVILLAVVFCFFNVASVSSKTSTSPELSSAIKMYKAKNYSESFMALEEIVRKDSSNALAYYYLAMSSAQIGKKNDAIEYYDKVMVLSSNSTLSKYAAKGKRCLEDYDRCQEAMDDVTPEESFIRGNFGTGFSEAARSNYEKHKIENLMREINRGKDIQPQKFKDYKDFSSSVAPSNEEIVAAMKVLQQAGFGNMFQNPMTSDLSLLTGQNGYNSNSVMDFFGGGNASSLSPQVIQSLMTNRMSIGL